MPDIHYLPPQMTIYVYLHQLHELFKEDIDISLLHVLELPLSKKIDTLSLGQNKSLRFYNHSWEIQKLYY